MFNITLLEYETNNDLGSVELQAIPRVGEFYISTEYITPEWQQNFFIVRAVTYTAGGGVTIHIEKYDVEAAKKRDELIREKIQELTKRGEQQ